MLVQIYLPVEIASDDLALFCSLFVSRFCCSCIPPQTQLIWQIDPYINLPGTWTVRSSTNSILPIKVSASGLKNSMRPACPCFEHTCVLSKRHLRIHFRLFVLRAHAH